MKSDGALANATVQTLVWDDIQIFLAVARSGSLTGAAGHTGLGIATVSRRIERLEAALGAPLFTRHQHGYLLSDDGERLMPRAEALESAASGVSAAVDPPADVRGHVRLATAENLSTSVIMPALPALLDTYPGLRLEVVTDVATVNLHRRDADMAVRLTEPVRGNLTLRRLGTLGFGIYASARYLRGSVGRAKHELADHQFIGWSDAHADLPVARWLARNSGGSQARLTTGSLASQVSAANAGMGLVVVPHFIAREHGLEQLPVSPGLDQPIWLVLHADLAASRRVRVVADFLIDLFARNHGRLAGDALEDELQ